MSLPLALALSPGALVEPFDPIRDFKALYRLAVWLLKFSPLVGIDYELIDAYRKGILETIDPLHNGIIIDLTGTDRIHGDHATLAQNISSLFPQAHVALSPTIGSAWALSRFGCHPGNSVVVHSSYIRSALSALPIQALRVPYETVESLHDVGIADLGQLFQLPRNTLNKRFGKFLLHRIEQCLGTVDERLHMVEAPAIYVCSRNFEPPLIQRGGIAYAIKLLFQELLAKLRSRRKIAKYFYLTVIESEGRTIKKEFPLASATGDITHLASILEPIIDAMTFFGEVTKITLRARQIETAPSEQHTFSAHEKGAARDVDKRELMNNFSIRLGKDRVSFAQLHQSYIPEISFSYESALTRSTQSKSLCGNDVRENTPHYEVDERPSILYSKPEPINTISMLPDKPPSIVQWRDAKLKILSGIGPERIAPEWWRGELRAEEFSTRDYFKIQDEHGRWLWVYRDQQSMEWFLHGVWA